MKDNLIFKKLFSKPKIWEYIAGISTISLINLKIGGEIIMTWPTSPLWLKAMGISWLIWWEWMLFRLLIIPSAILLDKLFPMTPPSPNPSPDKKASSNTIEKGETPSPKSYVTIPCDVTKVRQKKAIENEEADSRPHNNRIVSIPAHLKHIIRRLNKRCQPNANRTWVVLFG